MIDTKQILSKYARDNSFGADQLRELCGEVDRLRALVKDAEWQGESGHWEAAGCPWCYEGATHLDTCPAFTKNGNVR